MCAYAVAVMQFDQVFKVIFIGPPEELRVTNNGLPCDRQAVV